MENDDLKNYKAKAEFYVRQHTDNAVIAKLKGNIPLNSDDVKALEEILWNEVGTKQDYEAEYGQKPLGEFVREIVGLDMNAAKEAFAQYLNDASLDSRQIYFVNQIVEYIVHNGMMKDLSVLQEAPFTDHGSIVEVFTDLSVWMGIRQAIERVNANAVGSVITKFRSGCDIYFLGIFHSVAVLPAAPYSALLRNPSQYPRRLQYLAAML